jgi:2-haloacid dehalogenase
LKTVLAFDVYGTLIDTAGVVAKLRELVGPSADDFSQAWRDKQLEYSFRRGLMRQYQDFGICTRDALEYSCARFNAELSQTDKDALLGTYRKLPAFDDVTSSLNSLRENGFAMYAFSNGSSDAVETLLTAADIRDYFTDVVSVEDLQTFKPNPDVYQYFLRRSGAESEQAWLISGNPFDVIGAISAGLNAAWVKRSAGALFDPWGLEPTIEVTSLAEIGERISAHNAAR